MATAEAAKAIAASIINGNISETTHTSEVVILRLANRYLPLAHGPVTSVDTVTIDGATITPGDDNGYTTNRFGITRKYPHTWPVGKIVVTYKTGWQAGSEPDGVAEALTMLESWIDAKPELGISQITVGGESATRPATIATEVPTSVHALLAPWVRPHA